MKYFFLDPEDVQRLHQAKSNYQHACNEDEREQYRNEFERLKEKILQESKGV